MYSSIIEEIQADAVLKLKITSDQKVLPYSTVIALWQSDPDFRLFFIQLLRDAPFAAYFWETPPLTSGAFGRDFEFVLVKSNSLASVRPEPGPFRNQFPKAVNGVASFPNLSGDAFLLAPAPLSEDKHYSHLAAFVRHASEDQIHVLWQSLGEAIENRISRDPMWVSTAGMGVYWLHIRLDSRPKYYRYRPYRDPEFS